MPKNPSETESLQRNAKGGPASSVLTWGLILAVVGATTFSGKGIIVKLGYIYGTDGITLLMPRMLFALPIFVVMGWWAGRGKEPLKVKDWLNIIGLGFTGFFLASTLDFIGLEYITASLERLILCLQPTLVLLMGWVIFNRRIAPAHVVGMVVSYLGVLVVFGQEAMSAENVNAPWGALLVLLSTLSYATYLLWSGDLVKRLSSMRLVGLATSVFCVLAIIQYVSIKSFEKAFTVAPEVVWLSLINAILCTVVPVLTVMMAIERVGPAMASQIGMLGPISTIILGIIILNEPFTPLIALGAFLVIAGITVFTRAESKKVLQAPPAAEPEPQKAN